MLNLGNNWWSSYETHSSYISSIYHQEFIANMRALHPQFNQRGRLGEHMQQESIPLLFFLVYVYVSILLLRLLWCPVFIVCSNWANFRVANAIIIVIYPEFWIKL